jgi:hypothetical protein
MAFATLCFIRNLSDGPVSALVPAASNFRIGANQSIAALRARSVAANGVWMHLNESTDGLRPRHGFFTARWWLQKTTTTIAGHDQSSRSAVYRSPGRGRTKQWNNTHDR